MERGEVYDKVKSIVAMQSGTNEEQINDQTDWEDLDMDSLDRIEMIMAFEEEFHVEIPDEEGEKLKTVSDAAKYISDRVCG
jgi:acyl carrier protein